MFSIAYNATTAKAAMPKAVLSVADVCLMAGMSRATFYTLLNAHKISAVKRGRRTLIFPSELERFLTALPAMVVANDNVASVAPHARKRRRSA